MKILRFPSRGVKRVRELPVLEDWVVQAVVDAEAAAKLVPKLEREPDAGRRKRMRRELSRYFGSLTHCLGVGARIAAELHDEILDEVVSEMTAEEARAIFDRVMHHRLSASRPGLSLVPEPVA